MIIFLIANGLALVFFIVLLFYSVKGKWPPFFLANLAGLLAIAHSIFLEYTHLQTATTLLVIGVVVALVLIYDALFLFRQMKTESRKAVLRPQFWRRIMEGREYKMIFLESVFESEMERDTEASLTEKLQALEMWRSGNRAFSEGNLDEALEKYRLSVKWYPTGVAWVNQSGVYFEKEEYQECIRCCDEAIKINPDREEAWLNRGLAFMALKSPAKAVKSFDEALVVNGQNPEAYTLKANALRALNRTEEALEYYARASETDPNYLGAWFQKGITLNLLGRLEEAAECFRETTRLDKQFAPGYFHLANTLNRLDRNEEAVEAYRKAIRIKPDYYEAWNNLGIAWTKLNDLNQAAKCYRKALQIQPDYPEAWLNCALAYESLGKLAQSVACYARFLELAPDSFAKHKAIAARRKEALEAKIPEKRFSFPLFRKRKEDSGQEAGPKSASDVAQSTLVSETAEEMEKKNSPESSQTGPN
jgi:tetratricopeptide (TPR) repeat protein